VLLLLVFLMMTLGLFALFLGGGLVAQGYLYQQVADRMPVRAAVAAVLVGGFITLWVSIDRAKPGRYDVLHEFKGESTREFDEFEAVRWTGTGDRLTTDPATGAPVEQVVRYKKAAGGKGTTFLENGTGAPFQMTGSTGPTGYMTGAIRVKTADDSDWVRYNAEVKEDTRSKAKVYASTDRRFVEEKGSRYVRGDQLGTMYVPSTGTVVVALLLNFLLVVVWAAACWPVLRFSLGHALLLAGIGTLVTMIGVMPLLFKRNRSAESVSAGVSVRDDGGGWRTPATRLL
jgi:hypothetical protein